jgi:hypothetical protein
MSTKALSSGGHNLQEGDSDKASLVMPAFLTVLAKDFFAGAASVEVIKFEAGSQLSRLERHTFCACTSLTSICIPASIEGMEDNCFFESSSGNRSLGWLFVEAEPSCCLENVTFEPGSRLRRIAAGAFYGCEFLKGISIPASVEEMSAASFPKSRNCLFEIESDNRHFHMKGTFMIDFYEHLIVRYCGIASEVTISYQVEGIGVYCFFSCESIRSV